MLSIFHLHFSNVECGANYLRKFDLRLGSVFLTLSLIVRQQPLIRKKQ